MTTMMLKTTNAILALSAPPGGQQSTAPWYIQFFPFLLIIFVFYFVFILPQQKKAKQQEALIKGIRAGDKILTSSGIIGIVVGVKENSLSIRSADAKLEILKSAVSQITERSGDAGDSKP